MRPWIGLVGLSRVAGRAVGEASGSSVLWGIRDEYRKVGFCFWGGVRGLVSPLPSILVRDRAIGAVHWLDSARVRYHSSFYMASAP